MYQFTQKHKKIILIVVVVFLLPFIGFSFWPLMDRMRGSGASAPVGTFEIDGEKVGITADQFRTMKRRLDRVGNLGVQVIPQNPDNDFIWSHFAQVAEAEKLGIRVGDEAIRQWLQGMWARISQQGRQPYGAAQWKKLLIARGLRPIDFEKTLRETMMKQQLSFVYLTADAVSMDGVLEEYQLKNREVTLRAVRFGVDEAEKELKPVDFPLKPKLEAFYKDDTNRSLLESDESLMSPRLFESVEVIYAQLDAFDPKKHAEFLKGEEPSEAEIVQAYESLKYTVYKKEEPKKDPPKEEPKKDAEKPADPPKEKAGEEAAPKKKGDPGDGGSEDGGSEARPADAQDALPGSGQENPDAVPPGTDVEGFKPLDEVKDDVKRRVTFRKFMQKIHREVTVALDEARAARAKAKAAKKAEAPKDGGDKDKNEDEKAEAPAPLDLQAIVNKYEGVKLRKIGPLDRDGLDELEPFKAAAPYALAGHVSPLADGQLAAAPYIDAKSEFGFFARLMKQRARALKPLAEIEEGVRKVAMRKAAREAAKEKADAFYDAIKEKVKTTIKPELDKEVYGPLAIEKKKALDDANAARQKDGKPVLTAEDPEMKDIEGRFEQLKALREGPLIEKAVAEKMGELFDVVVAEMKFQTNDYTLFDPPRPSRRDRNFDWARQSRDAERFPIEAFIRYNGGLRSLKEVGDVSNPSEDYDKAAYVLKLIGVGKPDWNRIDPKTYERSIQDEQEAMMMREQMGLGAFGPRSLTTRYKLVTEYRTKSEDEQ